MDKIQELQTQINQLNSRFNEFMFNKQTNTRVNFFDILGKFEVVSSVPTGKPNDVAGQIKIYTNGTTYRLYWYDTTAGAWRYVPASGLSGTKVYYVSDTSGGAVTRKLTFTDGILTAET